METNLIIAGVGWVLIGFLFSVFIVYFGRNKFTTPKISFYYLLAFFMAGIFLLTISVGILSNSHVK